MVAASYAGSDLPTGAPPNSETTMTPAPPSSARYTLFVLFLINFLNFFDRILPAIVAEPLRKEFQLDDTMLGLLGTAFILVYAIAGLPLGRLSDRVRRTRVIAAGVFTWSVMTAATAGAWNLASLFVARLGVGIGEASAAPAANSLIGDLYPPERRARAFGLFMLGLPVGSLACYALGGYVAQRYGWRAPFLLAALPGLLAAAMMLGLRDPVRGAKESYATDTLLAVDRPYRRVLAIPTLWWIIASGATINFAAYSVGNFLPALLSRFHHASMTEAGLASSIALGAQLFEQIMRTQGDVDAVFFCNDDLAQGALMAALRMGIAVPQRVAVAGFNDLTGSDQMLPTLTTVRTPRAGMGEAAARMLLSLMGGESVASPCVDLGYELVVRGST